MIVKHKLLLIVFLMLKLKINSKICVFKIVENNQNLANKYKIANYCRFCGFIFDAYLKAQTKIFITSQSTIPVDNYKQMKKMLRKFCDNGRDEV